MRLILVAVVTALGCERDRASGGKRSEAQATEVDSAAPADPRLPGVARVDDALTAKLRARIAQALGKTKPRTQHLTRDGAPKYVNRLVLENSPYLLQHAFNPVNFFPWGDEALARAKRGDKPILLSIGYSTCHWCHVMERESFDDEEIAAFMNAHFVCIKVDREERPDLDELYMGAVQMLAGRGGWPMTVVLTPNLQPFFGGTYFPAHDGDRGARKGFLSILRELSDGYAKDRERIVDRAKQVSERLEKQARPSTPSGVPGPEVIASTAAALMRSHDRARGGFGGAPKFPQPDRLRLLMRYHRRTGDAQAREVVLHTLRKMAEGGIRDHVGGGFHRYATDADWLVPHFEKMLYDNALLAMTYVEAHQMAGDDELAAIAVEILDYVGREMTHPEGGFYSATDADSPSPHGEDEEGLFFTWTREEIARALPEEDLRVALAYWNVTDQGNFEGRNILHTPRGRDEVAAELGIGRADFDAAVQRARARLYEVRAKRRPPHLDDKILAGWNGLMISAFARAALALDRPDYAKAAARAAHFVLAEMRDAEGQLLRSHRGVAGEQTAFLDDHAFVVQALLDMYEASGDLQWVREAAALQAQQDARFHDDEHGGYYLTAHDQEKLVAREKPAYDGAVPAGNSIAIVNLLRLADITGDQTYRARAQGTLRAFGAQLERGGTGLTAMLGALDHDLDVPLEVVIVRGNDDSAPLLRALREVFLPNRSIHVLDGAAVAPTAEVVPLVTNKVAIHGRTTAYVCERGRCELPTSNAKVFARQLRKVHPLLEDG